jgi:preprotein translocase subunit SecE
LLVFSDCVAPERSLSGALARSLFMQKITTFFESVKIELGKVTWPTRKETVATTGVVVMIVFLISLYLGACDVVLSKLMRLILG